jgi:mono/diheme cytochrome c family protein
MPLQAKSVPAGTFAFGLLMVSSVNAQLFAPGRFPQQDGETIFHTVCQGCHMPNGQGASGAGAYPSLANNPKLAAAAYPIYIILNGQKAMPAFGASFDNVQIANIVNYVRMHFGNKYSDIVTVRDVIAARSQPTLNVPPQQ